MVRDFVLINQILKSFYWKMEQLQFSMINIIMVINFELIIIGIISTIIYNRGKYNLSPKVWFINKNHT